MSSILLILATIPLVAGSLLHAICAMLILAAIVNITSGVLRGGKSGFPGPDVRRHAKLAVPALAVFAIDAALVWLASGAPSA